MELLTLIPVIGFTLSWHRWQNWTASSAILHAVSAILLVLFLGSLVGLLLPITLLLMITGSVLAVFEGFRLVRHRASLPIPVVIFALLSIVFWTVHSGSSYFYYDEYSHWGVFLKEMLADNQLWSADTNSMHPRYLPGASLWQYFFSVFSRNPEGAAYLAQFALLLTPLLVLWERTHWRQVIWHVGIIVLVVVAVTNFGHGFVSLYVDHLLGAWYAGVLLNFLLELKCRRSIALFSYLLPLTVIVLIKTTGVFFAVSAAGIMALTLLVPVGPHIAGKSLAKRLLRATMLPVATIILSLSILFVWNINRDAIGLGFDGTSSGGIVSGLMERDSVFDSSQQAELTRRYIEVVMHQQISKDEISAQYNAFSYPLMPVFKENLRLTTASILGFSLIMLFLLSRTIVSNDIRQYWVIAAACVWLNAVAYIGILYLGYRYLSGNENGLYLSSYVRYAHSMLLPVVLFCFAPLVPAFAGSHLPPLKLAARLKVGRHSMIFFLVLTALVFFERPYLKPLYTTQRPPEIRTQLDPLTDQLRRTIGAARLWVFFPNSASNGFIGQMLQYQLSPGPAYIEEDASILLGNQEILRDELGNWEYAWFPIQDTEFDAALERLVGTTVTERIFRITGSGSNIAFEPVHGIF
jgi:hypothetical protein